MDGPSSEERLNVKRRFLTRKELSRQTGLSLATLQRYKDDEKIPFFQPGGRGARVVFPLDAIEAARRLQFQARLNPQQNNAMARPVARIPGPQPRWSTKKLPEV